MDTRNLFDTIYKPDGTPWPSVNVVFRLLKRFVTSDGIAVPEKVTVTTGSDGTFSVDLAVPESGAALYECILPSGGRPEIHVSAGDPIQLALLVGSNGPSSPDAVAVEAALRAAADADLQAQIDAGGGGGGGTPSGTAGGVLSGTYPNPSFAVDMATQAELDAETTARSSADTTLQTNITNEATTRATADSNRYTKAEVDALLLSYLLSTDFTWTNLSGKPSSFTPSSHASNHAAAGSDPITISESQVTNLTADLAAKASTTALNTHIADTANPHAVTAAQTGAYTTGQADTLLDLKAPLASPALTGTPTAPTATSGTNTTQLATTAFVQTAVQLILGMAPSDLDTLAEIAARLQTEESNYAALVTTVAGKMAKSANLSDLADAATARSTLGAAAAVAEGRFRAGGITHYSIPGVDMANSVNDSPAVNTVRYMPILVSGATLTIDRIAVSVQTAVASSFVRVALYNADSDWQPTTLVVDGGALDTSTTGDKAATVSATLTPGRYLMAINATGGAPTLRGFRGGFRLMGYHATLSNLSFWSITASQTYGAFPSTGTAWDTIVTGNQGLVYLAYLRITAFS